MDNKDAKQIVHYKCKAVGGGILSSGSRAVYANGIVVLPNSESVQVRPNCKRGSLFCEESHTVGIN